MSEDVLTDIVRTIVDRMVGLYGRWKPALRRDAAQHPKGPLTTVDEVLSGTHRRPACEVRWAAWLYLYDVRGWAVTAIARAWGRKGHAAITEGIQAARARADLTALVGAMSR